MPLDLSHLLDDDPNVIPDSPRPILPPESQITVEGGGGIRVSQSDDALVISGGNDGQQLFSGDDSPVQDLLAYMSYRAKLVRVGDVFWVTVATSYLQSVYYDSGWTFEAFQIPGESINAGALAESVSLYVKIPVIYYAGDYVSPLTPRAVFVSDPQTINGSPYTFTQTTATGYISRDRAAVPASYYLLTASTPSNVITIPPGSTDGTGDFHFLLATISQTGVQQIHLGALTLPQALTFQYVDLTVT